MEHSIRKHQGHQCRWMGDQDIDSHKLGKYLPFHFKRSAVPLTLFTGGQQSVDPVAEWRIIHPMRVEDLCNMATSSEQVLQ